MNQTVRLLSLPVAHPNDCALLYFLFAIRQYEIESRSIFSVS